MHVLGVNGDLVRRLIDTATRSWRHGWTSRSWADLITVRDTADFGPFVIKFGSYFPHNVGAQGIRFPGFRSRNSSGGRRATVGYLDHDA